MLCRNNCNCSSCKGLFSRTLLQGLHTKRFEKVNKYLAVIAAAIICPLTNTGNIPFRMQTFFFFDAISQMANDAGFDSAVGFMFIGLAGINFLVELGTNVVLSPVIVRLIHIGKRKLNKTEYY